MTAPNPGPEAGPEAGPDRVYHPRVVALFERPPRRGPLAAGPGIPCRGSAGSRELGTQVAFEARIDRGQVVDLAFRAYGCPHVIAACAELTESLRNQPASSLAHCPLEPLQAALGIPDEKRGRLLIVQDALRNCLADWDNTRPP
jgi:NifU-like protein involved in Fe-S cluster formation